MSAHITISPGTTYCEDTPANWRHFDFLKAALLLGHSRAHKPTTSQQFNQLLQKQISHENKRLRAFRAYLPGYEPDL